jgi:hypothetical protein
MVSSIRKLSNMVNMVSMVKMLNIVSMVIIVFIGRHNKRWVSRHFVWELDTSSWIATPIMIWFVLSLALKAPFVSASFYPACHVITAAVFFDWAVAFWTFLVVLVYLPWWSDWFNRVTFFPFVPFHLTFEADHGFA